MKEIKEKILYIYKPDRIALNSCDIRSCSTISRFKFENLLMIHALVGKKIDQKGKEA